MAKRAQSSQPTVNERLGKTPAIQAAVRSQGMYSYDEARPGYVMYDRNAGQDNSLMHLARALSGIDGALRPILERRLDKQVEEGVARGETTFADNPDENKNRSNFKDFIEANPQYTNDNPWLQVGYERARLRALGLDYKKALHDAASQNNIYNEKDLNVVRKFTDDFTAAFRKEHFLDKYEDKITLAQNFTAVEAQAKAGFYSAHSNNLRDQNEKLTIQQFTDLAVKGVESMTDLTAGGMDLDDPVQAEEGGGKKTVLGIIMNSISQAAAHGVQNANAPGMALNILTTLYKKHGNNPMYLEPAKQIEINGVKLINHPGVAEKIEGLERERISRQRADWQHGKAVEAYRERQEEKNLLGTVHQVSLTNAPATEETWNQLGVPARLRPLATKTLGDIYAGRHKMLQASPALRQEIATAKIRAERGDMEDSEAVAIYSQTGDESVLTAHMDAQKEENRTLTENLKAIGDKTFSSFARDRSQFGDVMTLDLEGQLSLEQKEAKEAAIYAQSKLQDAWQQAEQEKKRKLTSAEAVVLRTRVEAEVFKEMSDTFAKRRELEAQQPAAPAQPAQVKSPQPASKLDPAALGWVIQNFPDAAGVVNENTPPDVVRRHLAKVQPEALPYFENLMKGGGK